MTLEQLTAIIHMTARALYAAFNMPTHSSWEDLDETDKQRLIKIVGTAAREKTLSAMRWHQIWSEKMKDEGWVMGPHIDYESKQHPALQTYDELTNRSVVERTRLSLQADLIGTFRKMLVKAQAQDS